MGTQFKMAYLYGNIFDMLDKGLTGGAIQAQIEQIPVVGEYAGFLVPHFVEHEIVHELRIFPHAAYNMTETEYYIFQVIEFGLFLFQLENIYVIGNKLAVKVPF
jgi:hypothetical protein